MFCPVQGEHVAEVRLLLQSVKRDGLAQCGSHFREGRAGTGSEMHAPVLDSVCLSCQLFVWGQEPADGSLRSMAPAPLWSWALGPSH